MKGFSKDLNKEMEFPKGGVFSKVLAKSDTYNYTLMCLAKGTDIDTHTSTKNGGVQVLKGTGTFRLFSEDIEMKPLEIGGTHPALVNGNNIIVENMKSFFFCALLLTNKH